MFLIVRHKQTLKLVSEVSEEEKKQLSKESSCEFVMASYGSILGKILRLLSDVPRNVGLSDVFLEEF